MSKSKWKSEKQRTVLVTFFKKGETLSYAQQRSCFDTVISLDIIPNRNKMLTRKAMLLEIAAAFREIITYVPLEKYVCTVCLA